jgi:signal transduction histidine kinase
MTLRTRLLVLLIAALLPPIGVLLFSEAAQQREREEEIRRDAVRQAQQLAGELTRLVDGVQHMLRAVAASPIARQRDSAQCDEFLRALELASYGSASIGVADSTGAVTCLSRRISPAQLDIHERFYFREALRTNAFATGEFAIGKSAGAKAVHFGLPVQDAKGQPVGVAFAPLNLQWLAEQMSARALPTGSTVTVADRNGTVLVRLPEARLAGTPLPPEWGALLKGPGAAPADIADLGDATDHVVGYVPLGKGPPGLFVAVGLSKTQVMAPLRHATARAVTLGTLSVMVAIALAWLLAERFLYGPLQRLTAGAAALRRGDLGARIDERAIDDAQFAAVAATFNSLAESLQAREAERDRAEQQLRQARDRAEASTRSMSDLLAVASHDLRQPIHSMGLSAALLSQRLQGQPEEPVAQRLRRSAAHLVELLNGLLNVSQLDAGRITPEPHDFPADELLQSVTEEFAEQATELGIALRFEPTGAWIRSDPALLRRILVNYVSNAIKYTPRGGRIVIDGVRQDQQVELRVSDTGIGIAPGLHDAVWEEFRQLANPERDLTKGLGLGLAIVRRIGVLLGHQLNMRSQLNHGSCFSVHVPTAAVASRAPADDAVMHLRGRLLLVDDDAAVCASTADLLRDSGLEVVSCHSAEGALSAIAETQAPFDAVLADYRLPAQSGLEVIRAARTRWPGVAALLMTGGAPAARLHECEDEQVPVLLKPVGARELLSALAPAMRS